MAKICVTATEGKTGGFTVTVEDDRSKKAYGVTLSDAYHERLTGARVSKETAVEAAFRFLLEREPKEAILARFDLQLITRYFPEFERELASYL